MTDSDFNTATSIKKRIKELESILNYGSTLTLSGNLNEQEKVYVDSKFVNPDSKLLANIEKAIIEEIKELNLKFDNL